MNAARQKETSPYRLSPREIALVFVITFPLIGTLFPLDSYLGWKSPALAALVVKSPLNTTIILTVILSYIVWLFSRSPQKSISALKRNWILFAFLLWAFCTSRWMPEPGQSFNRTGRMLVFTLYAVYLIEFVPYRRVLQLLAIGLAISCTISLVMIVAAPSLSYSAEDLRGAWRGAMIHKNVLGGTASMTFLVALVSWRMKLLNPYHTVVIACLATFLLLIANSATALLAAFVITAILGYLIYVVNRVPFPLVLLFFTGLVASVVGVIIISSGVVYTLLGRDASLTGRAEVWEFASFMINQNPFWGYGNGIWTTDYFKPIVLQELHWPAPHAHNAWLDFRLQLGLPGFLFAVAIWAIVGMRLLYAISIRRIPEMALPTAIFILLSIRSYSETIIVDPSLNEMFWLAFSYAAFAALPVRERLRRRQQTPARRSWKRPTPVVIPKPAFTHERTAPPLS